MLQPAPIAMAQSLMETFSSIVNEDPLLSFIFDFLHFTPSWMLTFEPGATRNCREYRIPRSMFLGVAVIFSPGIACTFRFLLCLLCPYHQYLFANVGAAKVKSGSNGLIILSIFVLSYSRNASAVQSGGLHVALIWLFYFHYSEKR
jgi:hypothetical protein